MNRIRLCTAILAMWAAWTGPVLAINITNVVETGGDAEPTDTIVAQWTGSSFQVTVAGEPLPTSVIGETYTVGVFGPNAPAYVDRNHRYVDDPANSLPIPAYLVGQEYIMSGNDNRDNPDYKLDVTVAGASTVYMLIDNRLGGSANSTPPTFGATSMQWILDQGWTATSNALNRTANPSLPDEVAIDEGADGSVNQWFSVYQKSFPAGTFSLLQPDNAGQNMYGVVVGGPGVAAKPGDVNLDGFVDDQDYNIIRAQFGVGTSRLTGDLTGDGRVDFADFRQFVAARNNPAEPVPEPSAAFLFAAGAALMLVFRRCRGG